MSSLLHFGIAGAAGRGGTLAKYVVTNDSAEVAAVCDTNIDAIASDSFERAERYRDFYTMLWETELDVILVGTPAPHHVHQSIAALKRDLDVISEVPAGKNVGECRALVEECNDSAGTYLMAENYVYRRSNMIVRELVDAGRFGEVYYAEGEYLHELKDYDEETKWRRTWKSGINGIPYPTHELGPVLSWMPDDRIDRVCCSGSGHHVTDPNNEPYVLEDTTVMLGKTECDRLVKIRFDRLSERPHALTNYQLQGTTGCYEASRVPSDPDRLWLADLESAEDSADYEWRDIESVDDEYIPNRWQSTSKTGGHGGADAVMMDHFIEILESDAEPLIDIHRAMDMTLPGLLSIDSIADDGAWHTVPDSRNW